MAKKSAIEKDARRRRMGRQYAARRAALKQVATDPKTTMEARFNATLRLAKLPRNSAPSRARNRCEITGRPRGYYRKMRISRIAMRELGGMGLIPGLTKSSW